MNNSEIKKRIVALEDEINELKGILGCEKRPMKALLWRLNEDIEKHECMYKCWKQWSKFGKKKIGEMYERYIGYLYFKEGYTVKAVGLLQKTKLKGIDLIASKGNEIVLIQCKCHKHSEKIHSDQINKFQGAMAQYILENPSKKKVTGVFVTSAIVVKDGLDASNLLKITVRDHLPYTNNWPQIKCNVSADGNRHYYLPWVAGYNAIMVEPKKSEFYASSIYEAMDLGFMRAKCPIPHQGHAWDFWRFCNKTICADIDSDL